MMLLSACLSRKVKREREKEKKKRKKQEEGTPGCGYPGGVSVGQALSRHIA